MPKIRPLYINGKPTTNPPITPRKLDPTPSSIHRCQRRHYTQLLQEFLAAQGVHLHTIPNLIQRGWTKRMIREELAEHQQSLHGAHIMYPRDVIEDLENRSDIAKAVARNLEARAMGGFGHVGSICSRSTSSQDPVRQPSPRHRDGLDTRRLAQEQRIHDLMSRRPHKGGPIWSR